MKTKTLVTAILAALVMTVTLTSTVFAADKTATMIWQAKGDGRSAEVQFSDTLGGGRIHLFQNGDSTFLFYEIWGDDPTSESCQVIIDQYGNITVVCVFTRFNYDYGWGVIPSSDVEFLADGTVNLVTTTGAGFTSIRNTTDTSSSTPVTTTTSGIPHTFLLAWQPNDFSTFSTKGETKHAFASFAFKSDGSSESRSAYVSGQIDGTARELFDAPGRLGDTTGKNEATVTAP
jgi:hypothetical protein